MPTGVRIIRSEINVPTEIASPLSAAGNVNININEATATVSTTWTPRPWKSLVSVTAEVVTAGATLTLVDVTGSGFVQEIVVVMDYDMRLTVTIDGTNVINNLWSELDDLDTASNLISAWSPATGEYAIKLNVGNLLGFGSSLLISVTNPDTVADHNIVRKSIHYSLG